MKQYSESCNQNRAPILTVLRAEFATTREVLEIGSGTGQHAVYLAGALAHLRWHTSDLPENHPSIHAWIEESGLENIARPFPLDVTAGQWPQRTFDGVFSANTTHIMHWAAVTDLFAGVAHLLEPGGRFCLYGPFNDHGRYTSDSNARFDAWLKNRDPGSGIRDCADLDALAHGHGLRRRADHEMPVNNRLLVWMKP
jgi:cyclopropane fatty-acyl-phospholipid synthase-like methyltransferase